jgi:ATP-dependent DNA ligase
VLLLAGRDLTAETLDLRRALLNERVLPMLAEPIRCSPELQADLTTLIKSVKAQGFECLVAKNRASMNPAYAPVRGRRCG